MLHRLIAVTPIVLCLAALPAVARHAKDRPADQPTEARMTAPEAVDPGSPDSDLFSDTESQPADPAIAAPATSDDKDDAPEISVKLGDPGVKMSKRPKRAIKRVTKSADDSPKVLTPAQLGRAVRIAQDALAYRGAPYVWGGDGRRGVFDCSGFTQYLYAKKGIKLPHSAKIQFGMGSRVSRDELSNGDLVFFNTPRGPITHVGMYIGNGRFIHAANPRRGVITSNLSDSYYSSKYAGARRFSH